MTQQTSIAVVGMSGIFPGASSLDTFWHNIVHKVDAIEEVPPGRWAVDPEYMYAPAYKPDKVCSYRAGLVGDLRFDPSGYDLPPDLLSELDPLYHMLLKAGKKVLADCRITAIDRKRTGVALAAIALPTDASSEVARKIAGRAFEKRLLRQMEGRTVVCDQVSQSLFSRAACLSARVTSLPGAILARGLGLGGGSFTLDAACSSSLYAVKTACDDLLANRTDVMLAGGVSRPDSLYTQVGFTQLQAISPTGRCAPFDRSADGLVVGEGVGLVLLKRLDDALRDGNKILAVIRGIGLSNDIGGNLLAPDSEGQLRAMRQAYQNAGWSPADVDLIECHGAGTPVGDGIELTSLRRLWNEETCSKGQCAIGSIKSMIGHLLTGAGAAGLIKTLLSLHHRVLPPSLNFTSPAPNSPLRNGPFRVQTEPEEWTTRDQAPLRAAVSAFGFGGINAHLLLEAWQPETVDGSIRYASQVSMKEESGAGHHLEDQPLPHPVVPVESQSAPTVAITGMNVAVDGVGSLQAFQETIFNGRTIARKRPPHRWNGCEAVVAEMLDNIPEYGSFLDELSILIGEFHIPPNEIPDILPQHLLMLKVAADAMTDAGLPHREDRPRMGVTIGMEFDYEATDFHLRWDLHNRAAQWNNSFGLNLEEEQLSNWLKSLRSTCGPPLTSARTIGALGGIIASRIAKEFRFGGPSFVVSCEAASGVKALEIGLRSLQNRETDAFLVGAVDLPADVRHFVTNHVIRPYSTEKCAFPFDSRASGPLPCEGAVALVLKRLEDALEDGDRVYAVLKGIGCASGGGIDDSTVTKEAYLLSLERCFKDAEASPQSVSYVEAHGSGDPAEDQLEAESLVDFFQADRQRPSLPLCRRKKVAVGTAKGNFGYAGAAAGLLSVAKAGLCLYQEIIPPLANFTTPRSSVWKESVFHFPAFPQYWTRNRKEGPRRACVASLTTDGNVSHVILEGIEDIAPRLKKPLQANIERERRRPLGLKPTGLFVVEADNRDALLQKLDDLYLFVRQAADHHDNMEATARAWHLQNPPQKELPSAVSLVAENRFNLGKWIKEAKNAVSSDTQRRFSGSEGFAYSPTPLGADAQIAFVFPGSGNHYIGMGRGIGVCWPEILRRMDAETLELKTQLIPGCYTPWREEWTPGWEADAYQEMTADPLNMIFGQVVHGGVMANLVRNFSVNPSAVIGYSLGESAGLFAMGAWPERGKMLERMEGSDLFRTELAGPCNAARKVWKVPADEEVDWVVAAVNRPAAVVKKAIRKFTAVNLLIVNTPNECVIGGRRHQVEAAIERLGCDAFYLEGVVTVHCDAAVPVKEAYKALHLFPTIQPEGIRFYSCSFEKAYPLTSEAAATSILNQALFGFDFTDTIRQAYKDGVRVFLEMGPNASCSRMIGSILADQPHCALSACAKGEDDYTTFLKFLGTLAAERLPFDRARLYGEEAYPSKMHLPPEKTTGREIRRTIGSRPVVPPLPPEPVKSPEPQYHWVARSSGIDVPEPVALKSLRHSADETFAASPPSIRHGSEGTGPIAAVMADTIEAHDRFLDFSRQLHAAFADAVAHQTMLLETVLRSADSPEEIRSLPVDFPLPPGPPEDTAPERPETAFPREMCMEFAVGSVAKVLGPEFAEVDTYPVRVRLPDEPLMLVDRILSVQGEKCSLTSGRLVTEHDVLDGAWYLDGGKTPVCISIEAGQADLFLCSYLGIDLAVKGRRAYRLLDAVATFHGGLPEPGDVIRYEIEIEKFIRQGETYLFFFHFNGHIGNRHIISMRNGCAGFFTPEEVKNSGGIILTEEERKPLPGKKPDDWVDLVPLQTESYDETALEALRTGRIEACFGPAFQGIRLAESVCLPAGRMRLIHRVAKLEPKGGRFGLGSVRAETNIHPDDWFLTCHFVDDMVMPGTLMYECCAHTLRVLLMRLGWVTEREGVCYEPVPEIGAVLKCRGPVTAETRMVTYQVEIKEIGYRPEPYVLADALMYADGERIVMFRDMSLKMTGITRSELEDFWHSRNAASASAEPQTVEKPTLYDRRQLLAFCEGNPSEAFGEPYRIFDEERVIARLPRPPFFFMDRVTRTDPEPWVLKPGGWIEAEYRIPPDVWYFRANRATAMPFCVLLEIALQPCGWLAAYLGSALRSQSDLKFRNLGGSATLFRNLSPDSGLLTMRSRMTKASEAGGMIIQEFDMEVLCGREMAYQGSTSFGFFSEQALANQVGIHHAAESAYEPRPENLTAADPFFFADEAPLHPDDTDTSNSPAAAMPAKALRMIDRIDLYLPEGGHKGLGFIRGAKTVDPQEWFFRAHFYQDPVCPGSLGIESFLQLVKFAMLQRFEHLRETHEFELVTDVTHSWVYRGQVIQKNRTVEVDAWITKIEELPFPTCFADGFLKVDGLFIYQMKHFGVRLVPRSVC